VDIDLTLSDTYDWLLKFKIRKLVIVDRMVYSSKFKYIKLIQRNHTMVYFYHVFCFVLINRWSLYQFFSALDC